MQDFFAQPTISFGQSYGQTIAIFVKEWLFFVGVTGLYSICCGALLLLVVAVMFAAFATELLALQSAIDNGGRALLESSSWSSENSYSSNSNSYNNNYNSGYSSSYDSTYSSSYDKNSSFDPNTLPDIGAGFVITFGCVSILYLVANAYMAAIYRAMVTHATAFVYAKEPVSWSLCFSAGFRSVGRLFLLGLVEVVAYVFSVVVLALLCYAFKDAIAIIIILCIAYVVVFFLACVFISAAPSVIVVQGYGPINALMASFSMTKKHKCYIFCSIFLWFLVEFFFKYFLYGVGNNGSGVIILSFVMLLAITPMNNM